MDLSKKIEQILKDQTCCMFSESWYSETSNKIDLLNNEDLKGYVYFIKSQVSGYIKIGMTSNINKRMTALKQTNGNIILIGYFFLKEYIKTEKHYHLLFKENRVFGEWFNLSHSDIIVFLKKEGATVLNCEFNSKINIEEGIVLSNYIGGLRLVDKNEVYFNEISEYMNNATEKNKRYDTKEIYLNLNLPISQKKMTLLIMRWVEDNGFSYIRNRNHASRGFIYI